MRILFFVLLLAVTCDAFCAVTEYVHSVGFGLTTVTNYSELQTRAGKKALRFEPNIPSNIALSAETKYIDLSYSFATANTNPSEGKSRYRDLRLNFSRDSFDVRLNYQFYKGAVVHEAGRSIFYRAYEVRSTNARAHYYFRKDQLQYIRDGVRLIERVTGNEGLTTSGSWFLGLNVDQRLVTLPKSLVTEHEARVQDRGIDYETHLRAMAFGPLAGGDGTVYLHRFFLRSKFGVGPAFLTTSDSVLQYEFAFNLGVVVAQRHLVSLNLDAYGLALHTGNGRLANTNSSGGLFYTYAFR